MLLQRIAITFFVGCLSACAAVTPAVTTTTVVPAETRIVASSTPLASPTVLLPSPDPMTTDAPIPTPRPGPLSAIGPWLEVSIPKDAEKPSKGVYVVMNADGSGYQPVRLPSPPENRTWTSLGGTNGPFLAFRTIPTEGASFDVRADGFDDQIWIVKLPENQVVRKLPLISEAAWKIIHTAQEKDPGAFNGGDRLPTQLGLIVDPDSYQWSPHGRYLTYSAALDGTGTDLYLYDTEKDTTRRLTHARSGAQVWFWSPDGSTVFYRNGHSTAISFSTPDLEDIDGVYALNLFAEDRFLYLPKTMERIVNVTGENFLVGNYGFEEPPWNLRLVNYKTGSIRYLYKEAFTDIASDTSGKNVLLLFDPTRLFNGPYEGRTPGIYRIDLTSGRLDFLCEGNEWIEYKSSLGMFLTKLRTGQDASDLILFSPDGQDKKRFPNIDWLSPSPDGQWLAVGKGEDWSLYSRDGESQAVHGVGNVTWLSDSSGFYQSGCQAIIFYAKANNWQPETVAMANCGFSIVPPHSSAQ